MGNIHRKSRIVAGSYFKLLFLFVLTLLIGCSREDGISPDDDPLADLKILPADSGGEHLAFTLTANNTFGHYLYLPGGYQNQGPAYPMIVFLHGGGERGNSMDSAIVLEKVLTHGPPNLIKKGQWSPTYPAIVVSPQCHDEAWDVQKIHRFVGEVINRYNVNSDRVYITGLSLGGNGVFGYVSGYGTNSFAAAAVPISGWGNPETGASYEKVALWAFHNVDDERVPAERSIEMVDAINEVNPREKAKITVFPAPGHNAWERVYTGKGFGTEMPGYDPYNETIYDWMYRFKKVRK